MKKKIFMFLLSLFFILPGTVLLTACGDDDSSGGSSSGFSMEIANGIYFTNTDVETFDPQHDEELWWEFFNSGSGDVAVWAADYYDKDSLKICLNEEELELTLLDAGDDYATRYLSPKCRKLATFTWDFNWQENTGDWELKATADEAQINIRFVSNGQTFSEEEQAILSDWCMTDAEGKDLLSLMDSDYVINTTYCALLNYGNLYEDVPEGYVPTVSGIRYFCKKTVGYYKDAMFFNPVDSNIQLGQIGGKSENYNNRVVGVANIDETLYGGNYVPQNFDITFDKEYLCLAKLELYGNNFNYYTYGIVSVYNGNTKIENYDNWLSNNENDITIYLEPYDGVDLSNVEVYIYNTKMNLKTDPQNGKKYFVIEKGKLPIDYYTYTEEQELGLNMYDVDIRNVDILSDCGLFTTFELKYSTNKVSMDTNVKRYYQDDNGVTYYMPNQNGYIFFSCLSYITTERPSEIIINGTHFDIRGYVKNNKDNLPNADDSQYEDYTTDQLDKELGSYYKENNSFVDYTYNVKIGSKDTKIIFGLQNNNVDYYLNFFFAIAENTTLELVF